MNVNWTEASFPAAGTLGLVAGDATSAALTVNHAFGRKLIPSFYNSPGIAALSNRLRLIYDARIRSGQHDGVSANPSGIIPSVSSGPSGLRFTASHSGTKLTNAGEVAEILVDTCKDMRTDVVAPGRVTVPTAVTVVDLHTAPQPEEHPTVKSGWSVLQLLPIATSVAGSAYCALQGDLWSASIIALGMLSTGIASHALGSGDLTFTRPASAPGVPAGGGYLESGNEIVILRGEEGAVASVTRGQFALRYNSELSFRELAISSSLLTAQTVAQILLVPFGSSHGQLSFLATLGVSWLYNSYVAGQEKQAWRRMVLEDLLQRPSITRYTLGTRAATAVFVMSALRPEDIEKQLFELVPNETAVWALWRRLVANALQTGKHELVASTNDLAGLNADEQKLLNTLLADAQAALSVKA